MKINTNKDCDIMIFDDTEYPVNGLAYEDSVSLYIAQLNESNNTTILYNQLDNHKNSNGKPIHLQPQKNGYITMCHIILPIEDPHTGKIISNNDSDPYLRKVDFITQSGIDTILYGTNSTVTRSTGDSTENQEETIISPHYFSDGTNIYRRNSDNSVEQVSEQELVEVNPKSFDLRIQIQNFFSVCYLRKCYVSLCQKIFNDRGFDRCFNSKVSSQLRYKRDLVWAALNVIQYMIDSNQLAEAQRLLERINGCNGLCSKEETGESKCGCE